MANSGPARRGGGSAAGAARRGGGRVASTTATTPQELGYLVLPPVGAQQHHHPHSKLALSNLTVRPARIGSRIFIFLTTSFQWATACPAARPTPIFRGRAAPRAGGRKGGVSERARHPPQDPRPEPRTGWPRCWHPAKDTVRLRAWPAPNTREPHEAGGVLPHLRAGRWPPPQGCARRPHGGPPPSGSRTCPGLACGALPAVRHGGDPHPGRRP